MGRESTKYYKVIDKIKRFPPDHHQYGYETEFMFTDAVTALHRRWAGKSGRCIEEKNDFACIRFYNKYKSYDDVWIPDFLLQRVPSQEEEGSESPEQELNEQLDSIFGFD